MVLSMLMGLHIGLHRFQILPILQVPSTGIKCIHKYKYRYRYMIALYSGQYISIFGVVKCYASTVIFNYLVKSCYYLYNNRIGTCVTYFTDSDTTKKCWYWPDIQWSRNVFGIGGAKAN